MKNKDAFLRKCLRVFGDEKRQAITIPLFAILLSLIVGAVIILCLGKNPIQAYIALLQGSGLLPKGNYAGGKNMLTDFTSFMNEWTPMLFAALAVAVALRAGLFNIGVSGQMLVAGFISSITIGYSTLSAPIAKPLVLVIAVVSGGVVGALIGWLRHRFNINEVVSSIMLNYIAMYSISFCIQNFFIDPVSRQSVAVSAASRWTLMSTQVGDLKMDIPLGIVIALAAAFILRYVFQRTTFGYELRSVGTSPNAAKYAGIRVGKTIVVAMALSGALAGLAGAMNFLGYNGSIQPSVLPTIGFDAIAVALLAGSNPVGIIFTSFLVTVLSKGSTYMSSTAGLITEMSSVITGLVLLFSACGAYMKHTLKTLQDNLDEKKEG